MHLRDTSATNAKQSFSPKVLGWMGETNGDGGGGIITTTSRRAVAHAWAHFPHSFKILVLTEHGLCHLPGLSPSMAPVGPHNKRAPSFEQASSNFAARASLGFRAPWRPLTNAQGLSCARSPNRDLIGECGRRTEHARHSSAPVPNSRCWGVLKACVLDSPHLTSTDIQYDIQ